MDIPDTVTASFHEDDHLPIHRRARPDLPPHVTGIAIWYNDLPEGPGYYIPRQVATSKRNEPVEFTNNNWFGLFHSPAYPNTWSTCASAAIAPNNTLGLGYWDVSDPQHPDFTPIVIDPPDTSNPTPHTTVTYQPAPLPTISSTPSAHISATRTHPTTMSAGATGIGSSGGGGGGGGGGGTGGTIPTGNGRLKGTPPTIFDGTRSKADKFLSEFRRYKLTNRLNDTMIKPFDRVLTALTYIRGTNVDDWVDAQEQHLIDRTDVTKTGFVRETDEVLWTEFETAFKTAFTDTTKKQQAYDQLVKLRMQGFDIDTYIATFDRLALAAKWEQAAEGTIAQFRAGLHRMIHSKALDRDKIPTTMDEWKAAARTEVSRAREKYSAGLTGAQQRNQRPRDPGPFHTNKQHQSTPSNPSNSSHVPMDVDATTTTTNFKKLTPEERDQLAKEGHCFRCRLQGHVARNCPKNTSPNSNKGTTARTADTGPPNVTTTATIPDTNKTLPTPPDTTAPKLTRAQRIRAIEEEMEEDERSAYLDSRDMGEDFWSAGA